MSCSAATGADDRIADLAAIRDGDRAVTSPAEVHVDAGRVVVLVAQRAVVDTRGAGAVDGHALKLPVLR